MRLAAAAAVSVAACATPAEQPAVIVGADAASRAELATVVATMLRQPQVVLADDALTRTDLLLIERTAHHADDRSLERPIAFRLVIAGKACVLVGQADGHRRRLDAARCRPLP